MSMKYNDIESLYENIFEVAFNEKIIKLLENVLGRKITHEDSKKISRHAKAAYFNSSNKDKGKFNLDLISAGREVYTLNFHHSVRGVGSEYIMTSPGPASTKQIALYVDIGTSGNPQAIVSNLTVIPSNGFCDITDSYLEERVAEIEKMAGFDIKPHMAFVIRSITKDMKGLKGHNFSYVEKLCSEKNLSLQINLIDGDVSYSVQENS